MNMTQKKKQQQEALPMWKIVLSQFLEHRMAVVGAVLIGFFLAIALAAPLISTVTGLHPEAQNVFNRYQPFFTRSAISPIERELRVEAFIERSSRTELKNYLSQAGLLEFESPAEDVLFDLAGYYQPDELQAKLAALNSDSIDLAEYKSLVTGFSRFHVLGTDELGRDVFIRLVYGTRVSITVGLMVAFAAAMIGLIVGSLAGYYGGVLDAVLMRITDSLIALPILVVLIVVSAIDLENILDGTMLSFIVDSDHQSIIKMIMILCIFSWMQAARLIRGSILAIKEQEFVMAARTLGAKDRTIIVTHIIPNVVAPLLVAVTLGVGNSILMEAALSFLGLGIQPPTPSWGNMLFNAQEMIQHSPLLAILPGFLILLTVISFNYVGDGLQDAIDPKAIRR